MVYSMAPSGPFDVARTIITLRLLLIAGTNFAGISKTAKIYAR